MIGPHKSPHKPNWKAIWATMVTVAILLLGFSDVILKTVDSYFKEGLTIGTIGVFGLYLNKAMRRKKFEARDARWEAKLDAIMKATGATIGSLPTAATNSRESLKLSQPVTGREGVSKVKNWLRKLGKTKFQTYLLTTVLNLLTLYLTWTGTVDIDSQVQGYMPVITVVVQLIATGVYQLVEGSIDKANLQKVEVTVSADSKPENPISSEK
ncbi:hypothetical protein [Gorillibacterium sp. CAU 1737]|uniref:hypothetical protein n=1 Tax=Gorillibacterium sp. CAU 1737 TaxID=3140362 RepID=UPI003260E735